MLLDDELPGLTYLKMLCEQLDYVEVVRAFNNPEKLLEEAKNLDFDVCLLDIEMPGINGLEVAELLVGKAIIFTTAYKEYAAEAFNLNAIDYLTKPIQKERLEKALQKAAALLLVPDKEKEFAQLNTNKGKTLLYFDQIISISNSNGDKRDKIALLENKQEIVLKNCSFEQLLAILPKHKFCRINKREIIALRTVDFFNHNTISTSLKDSFGKSILFKLSDNYKNDFMQKMQK